MDCTAIMELAKTEIRKNFDSQESSFNKLNFSHWSKLDYCIYDNNNYNNLYKPGVYIYSYKVKDGMLDDEKPWLYADYIGMSTFKISQRRAQFITVLRNKNVFENSRQDHIGAEKAKKIWNNPSVSEFYYCIANCPPSYAHEVEQILLDDYWNHYTDLPVLQGQWTRKYKFK